MIKNIYEGKESQMTLEYGEGHKEAKEEELQLVGGQKG